MTEIKTEKDIQEFLDRTNSLHDGYLIGTEYRDDGITKIDHGHFFDPAKTKLTLRFLVTSIYDALVEIEFRDLLQWQVRCEQWDITDTAVLLLDHDRILWCDDTFTGMEEAKKGSYAIAGSMKWRILEHH